MHFALHRLDTPSRNSAMGDKQ